MLKEYYEIVDEARPLSGFSPRMLICLQKCISNHKTKQASKFQSDPLHNRRLKNKLLNLTVYFLLSY